MSRHVKHGLYLTGNGKRIAEGTVSVFLAGTTTAASIYAASSGGAAVNSVLTGTDGMFTFYVDTDDYNASQLFKITLSKTNYTSKTVDDIPIIPGVVVPHGATTLGHTTNNSQAITCTALDTWYPIEHASITWTVASDDGITPDAATGGFLLPSDGDYLFMASVSAVGSRNNIIPILSFLVNDSYVTASPINRRKMANASDVGSLTVMADAHDRVAGEILKLGVMLKTGEGANTAGDTITVENASIFVQAIEI